jgi:hypothetical protein
MEGNARALDKTVSSPNDESGWNLSSSGHQGNSCALLDMGRVIQVLGLQNRALKPRLWDLKY